MITHDFRHHRQAQTAAFRLGRDERFEEVRLQVVGNPLAIILHADHQGQMNTGVLSGNGKANPVPVRGSEDHFSTMFRRRLSGIFDEVQEHLHELIMIAVNKRQRRVKVRAVMKMAAETILRDPRTRSSTS